MNLHDWSRVEDGTFHDFPNGWIIHLKDTLNKGRLPEGYYAQSEQHVGRKIADVLALHESEPDLVRALPPPGNQAVALAEAPPRVSLTRTIKPSALSRHRTLTIRHTSGHRIVALVEIVSQANKSSADAVAEFISKIGGALRSGIHVVVVDLLPAGRYDPQGMNDALMVALQGTGEDWPAGKPLTFASYVAKAEPTAYVECVAVGDPIPDLPLFLTPTHYVTLPLGETYATAYEGVPGVWRKALERNP
jgi:hypothetical protein